MVKKGLTIEENERVNYPSLKEGVSLAKLMKIVRFDTKGNCQFIYFNWRKFRFETSC